MTLTTVILMCLLSAIIASFAVYVLLHKRISSIKQINTELRITLEKERELITLKQQSFESNKQQLNETFSLLSGKALRHNNEQFLKLANENLKQFQLQAHNQLNEKEKSIENLVKPIKETLQKTEQQIRSMENERKQAYGSLSQQIINMAQTQQALQNETRNLVKALSRPEVRGQWGEMTLKRLAELAGMVEHCDFIEQMHVENENNALRPDMIIRLPGGREIIVDVKTPLDAYLKAAEADNDEARKAELLRHTRNVKQRIKELSQKAYWKQFKNTPDFVVLFIPGDQFLSAALDIDASILESAMQQKVILATPTSFVALLRAIAYGWRQESLAENAEHIRQLGEDLYARLATFSDHLAKLGKSLNGSVLHFNKAIGSFDARILPSARKFTDMGIGSKKEMERINQIEITSKNVEPCDNPINVEGIRDNISDKAELEKHDLLT